MYRVPQLLSPYWKIPANIMFYWGLIATLIFTLSFFGDTDNDYIGSSEFFSSMIYFAIMPLLFGILVKYIYKSNYNRYDAFRTQRNLITLAKMNNRQLTIRHTSTMLRLTDVEAKKLLEKQVKDGIATSETNDKNEIIFMFNNISEDNDDRNE